MRTADDLSPLAGPDEIAAVHSPEIFVLEAYLEPFHLHDSGRRYVYIGLPVIDPVINNLPMSDQVKSSSIWIHLPTSLAKR